MANPQRPRAYREIIRRLCHHPDPELCRRVGRHVFGEEYAQYLLSEEGRARVEATAKVVASRREISTKAFPLRVLPCRHAGAVTTYCPRGIPDLNVMQCDLHDECTFGGEGVTRLKVCRTCSDYSPQQDRFEYYSLKQLTTDTLTLAGKLRPDLAGVGGVVRSGMIPAAILATNLHLPLWEISEWDRPRELAAGGRSHRPSPSGPLLVVDDSIYHGHSQCRVRARIGDLGREVLYAAIYCRIGMESHVDYFARRVEDLHMLEWNFWNNGPVMGSAENPGYGRGIATDLDGILCHDHESGGTPGTVFNRPRKHPVPLIVTGRSERHRGQTELWLRSQGILWRRLEMLPLGRSESPQSIADWKAERYHASGCGLYVESDAWQAERIHHLTRRPVLCPRTETVFQIASVG